MNKTITKNKTIKRGVRNYSQEFYPIYVERGTPNKGRKPSKLGNTLRILNVGDEFLYPYTTANSVYRLARQLGIFVKVTRTYGGFIVRRIKSDVIVIEKPHIKTIITKPSRKPSSYPPYSPIVRLKKRYQSRREFQLI